VEDTSTEVRIAFDGDSVLFDEEADRVWREQGQEAFFRHEVARANVPLSPGPFQPLLEALARIQSRFPRDGQPIRTALVTARSAPAHRRVVNTFRHWHISVDEAYFLGGIEKIEILSRFRPHIFFDDQLSNLEQAANLVPSAQVPAVATQLGLFQAAQIAHGPSDSRPTTLGHGRAVRPAVKIELPVRHGTGSVAASKGKDQGPASSVPHAAARTSPRRGHS
jgi:hypothetical protein